MRTPSRSSELTHGAPGAASGEENGRARIARSCSFGQPEDALPEDVVLDLVGAAGDRDGRDRHEHLGDGAIERRVGRHEHARGAGDRGVHAGGRARDGAAGELADRPLRPRRTAEGARRGRAVGGRAARRGRARWRRAIAWRTTGSPERPVALAPGMTRSTRPARCGYQRYGSATRSCVLRPPRRRRVPLR